MPSEVRFGAEESRRAFHEDNKHWWHNNQNNTKRGNSGMGQFEVELMAALPN